MPDSRALGLHLHAPPPEAPSPDTSPPPRYHPAGQRDPLIDALRALALLGILVVNLPFFALPGGFAGSAWQAGGAGPADIAAAALIQGLFENKFILLFSALFGFGAWQQLARGDGARYGRRLVILALFGAGNLAFLFAGDILLPYALIGLALPWLARLPERQLLALGLALWCGAVLGDALYGIATGLGRPVAPAPPAADVMAEAGFWAASGIRLRAWAAFQPYALSCNYPLVAAAMIAGLLLARRMAEAGRAATWALLRRLAGLALLPGLAGNLVYAWVAARPETAEPWRLIFVSLIFRPLFAVPLSLVLAVGLIALLRRPEAAGLARRLAPAGRLSLTIYLGMSLVCTLIFLGYGLGLRGSLRLPGTLALSLGLHAGFVLAAGAWERRFGRGPAEAALARLLGPARPRRPRAPRRAGNSA